MSLFSLAYGSVVTPAKIGTSSKGSSYARLMMRSGDGDSVVFLTVMTFDEDSIAALEPLQKGDGIAASGELQIAPYMKDGTERIGYTLFNARALTASKPKPKPRLKKDKALVRFDAEAWFGKEAGEI